MKLRGVGLHRPTSYIRATNRTTLKTYYFPFKQRFYVFSFADIFVSSSDNSHLMFPVSGDVGDMSVGTVDPENLGVAVRISILSVI